MTVTFYLDVYFAVNFMMDLLLIRLVRKILKLPNLRLRSVLAAAAGALWACAAVLVPVCAPGAAWLFTGWTGALITWILVGGGMALLAWGRQSPEEYVRSLGALWLTAAAAGGLIGAFAGRTGAAAYLAGGVIPAQMSAVSLLCFMAAIYFGICACVTFVRQRILFQRNLYEVTLICGGREKQVTALLDTGNQLYEPYGHRPVHVITGEACRDLWDPARGVIYIPFTSVGDGHGVLPGIRMDEMRVSRNGRTVMVEERPWLALSRRPLSAAHRYEMLLHGEEQK